MDFNPKVSNRILFTEDGTQIEPGDLYFEAELHGRTALFLAEEVEEELGLATFTSADRKKLAGTGAAMSDGSFPIRNCSDAMNARQAIGRAHPSKRGAVRSHIASREKALGCNNGPAPGSGK